MDASVDSLPYYDKELEIPGKPRFVPPVPPLLTNQVVHIMSYCTLRQ